MDVRQVIMLEASSAGPGGKMPPSTAGKMPAATWVRLFAIDFNHGAVSMAAVMRAFLYVVNERRQQMAGWSQVHPAVRPERAMLQRVRGLVSTALGRGDSLE